MPEVFLDVMRNWKRPRRGKNSRAKASWLNNATFWDYFYRMKEICLNQFELLNLPETVDQRYVMELLFNQGYCIYFKDEVVGDLCLQCTYTQDLDVYGYPLRRRGTSSYNGYQSRWLTNKDSVIIFNNYMHTSSAPTVALFAQRLCECQRTMDVNVNAQKTPILIRVEESQLLTMKNALNDVEENNTAIFSNKNVLTEQPFEVVQTNAPFVSLDVNILKRQYWNEFLSYRGIENVSSEKKERLVTEEVSSTMGGILAQRNVFLQSLQDGFDKVNKMFGTNIEVKYKVDIESLAKMEDEQEVMDENVSVHNRTENAVEDGVSSKA